MPPLPPLPTTAKFSLHQVMNGGPATVTSFYMKYTGAMAQADALTLCTTLATSWNTRIGGFTTSNWTLFETQCEDLNSQSGVNVVFPTSHPGSAPAGAFLSAAAALVISAKIAFRYRGGHPRVYIPGMQQVNLTDGNSWAPTFIGNIIAGWNGMLSDLTSTPPAGVGSMSAIAWHRYSSNPADFPSGHPTTKPPWPLVTPVPHAITSWAVNPQVASQRRRNQQ